MIPLRWLHRQILEDPIAPPAPDELILVCKPSSEPEAARWRELLANVGIQSAIKNTNPVMA